ncbi:MAG TPA: hypothetical protein VLQ93_03565 [Myxococcaceae bacterium]|nr:hypothetical protein [Myxococcaceae bacterium]
MAHESGVSMSTWGDVGGWVGLVLLTVATYVLGRHVALGPF